MKKLITSVVLLLTVLAGCSLGKPQTQDMQFFAMNTKIDVMVYSDNKQILDDIQAKIKEIEDLMSVSITESDVNKINENAGIKPVKVSDLTYDVIKSADKYHKLTEDTFQVTIYPLVKLWNINLNDESDYVPTSEQIKKAKQYSSSKYLQLNDELKTVYLTDKNAGIDLGAIAKGYAADKIIELFNEKQIKHGWISLGGGIQTLGGKIDNSPWVLGLENPIDADKGHFAVYELYDGAVMTSGDYQRFRTVNGVKYHHIIDSKTGYPANNELASVTIIAKNSMDADALSTACYVMGLQKGFNFITELENVEAVFVTHNKQVYVTKGLKNNITITDKEFTINEIR